MKLKFKVTQYFVLIVFETYRVFWLFFFFFPIFLSFTALKIMASLSLHFSISNAAAPDHKAFIFFFFFYIEDLLTSGFESPVLNNYFLIDPVRYCT